MLEAVILLVTWMDNVDGGYFIDSWAPAVFILAVLMLLGSAFGEPCGVQVKRLTLGFFAAYASWTFASLLWSANRGDA